MSKNPPHVDGGFLGGKCRICLGGGRKFVGIVRLGFLGESLENFDEVCYIGEKK